MRLRFALKASLHRFVMRNVKIHTRIQKAWVFAVILVGGKILNFRANQTPSFCA